MLARIKSTPLADIAPGTIGRVVEKMAGGYAVEIQACGGFLSRTVFFQPDEIELIENENLHITCP